MSRLILDNISIICCDWENTFISQGHLQIEDDRILTIGQGLYQGQDGKVISCSGQVALPGFVNAHTHVHLTALRGLSDDAELFEWLEYTNPIINSASEEQIYVSLEMGYRDAIRNGTTCLCDCSRMVSLKSAKVAEQAGIRAVVGGMVSLQLLGGREENILGFVLNMVDEIRTEITGRTNGRIRAFLGAHAPYTCSSEQLQEVKAISRQWGLDFNIHLAEAFSEVEFIEEKYGKTPAQFLYDLEVLDDKTLIDHGVHVNGQDIKLLKDARVKIAHCPISNGKLGCGIAPVPAMLEAGITVGLGTDSLLSNNSFNMLEEMKFAVIMQRALHNKVGVMNTEKALRMATIDGAKCLGLEEEIGSLEVGKKADLILMEKTSPLGQEYQHILSEIVYYATPEQIKSVLVDGKFLMKDRVLL